MDSSDWMALAALIVTVRTADDRRLNGMWPGNARLPGLVSRHFNRFDLPLFEGRADAVVGSEAFLAAREPRRPRQHPLIGVAFKLPTPMLQGRKRLGFIDHEPQFHTQTADGCEGLRSRRPCFEMHTLSRRSAHGGGASNRRLRHAANGESAGHGASKGVAGGCPALRR
jgi:hypothetical protein